MQTQEKTESPKTPWHNPYVDVKQKHWFAPGVQFVTERHWMQPWQPRRFGPRGVINKQPPVEAAELQRSCSPGDPGGHFGRRVV